MKKRLFSNWVTTVLGVLIILVCLYLMIIKSHNTTELSGWLATGLLFLRSKDSLIALEPK
jgi:hypothetical protein